MIEYEAPGDVCPVCACFGFQPCVDEHDNEVPDHPGRPTSWIGTVGR